MFAIDYWKKTWQSLGKTSEFHVEYEHKLRRIFRLWFYTIIYRVLSLHNSSFIINISLCNEKRVKKSNLMNIYILGQMNMYMRDCTDGVNFAAEYTDVRRPRADNQTYCERKGDTGTYCVRMCRGNFCNGPFANSASKYLISGILWVVIVLNFISVFQEVHHGMWHLLCQCSIFWFICEWRIYKWYAYIYIIIYNWCFEGHVSSKL